MISNSKYESIIEQRAEKIFAEYDERLKIMINLATDKTEKVLQTAEKSLKDKDLQQKLMTGTAIITCVLAVLMWANIPAGKAALNFFINNYAIIFFSYVFKVLIFCVFIDICIRIYILWFKN